MKTKKIYHSITFICFVTLGALLVLFGISLAFLSRNNIQEISNINNAIQATGIGLTGLTIIFLAINYIDQKKQLNSSQESTDLNRTLDIVYRQFEISLPQIKEHTTYRTLNRIMNDYEIPDYDIAQEIDTYSETILTFLINTKGLIKNFIFILNNSNLDVGRKNFIRNIICDNLNSNFFWVFDSFKNFCIRYPNDTWGMLEHIQDILLINEELTD